MPADLFCHGIPVHFLQNKTGKEPHIFTIFVRYVMDEAVQIRPGLSIPRHEIWFEFSHSSGPGGQNVNKVATAATLCFHPGTSSILTPYQKDVIQRKLARRINADGVLRIAAEDERSQSGNRRLATERFCQLLAEALRPRKKRTPTRPTRGSIERRLLDKKLRSARKANRRKDEDLEM